jgi:hypothetical protein
MYTDLCKKARYKLLIIYTQTIRKYLFKTEKIKTLEKIRVLLCDVAKA